MKVKAQTTSDIRVWCYKCFVRIAPNEERVTDGDKAYHQACHSKLAAVKRTSKK